MSFLGSSETWDDHPYRSKRNYVRKKPYVNPYQKLKDELKAKDSRLKLAVEFIQLLRSDGRNHVQIDPIVLAERCEKALEEIRGKQ